MKPYKSPRPTVDPIKAYNQAVQAYNAAISACPNAYDRANHENNLAYIKNSYQTLLESFQTDEKMAEMQGQNLEAWRIQQDIKNLTNDNNRQIDAENSSYANLCK